DGIRDRTVTGVQTCALPIYFPAGARFHPFSHINGRRDRRALILPMTAAQGVRLCRKIPRTFSSFASGTHKSNPPLVCASVKRMRSEERRVGKKCKHHEPSTF